MEYIIKDIYGAYRPAPPAPPGAFAGQAVCVVGGTAGLGLAAALHCVRLGAAEVYITARDAARGEAARRQLIDATAAVAREKDDDDGPPSCAVAVLALDLGRFASVTAFAEELRRIVRPGRGGVDYLLLNAAVLEGGRHAVGAEGWVAELQVNTLGLGLLALLLLPWLRAERARRAAPAHLAFGGSGEALRVDAADWARGAGGENILRYWNKRENWPQGLWSGYAVSKALTLFAMRHMVELARGRDGRPWLIINNVDPGMVKTDIQRHLVARSLVLRMLAPPVNFLIMKTPEVGSRIMVKGGLTSEAEHGHLLAGYLTNESYQRLPVVASDAGKRMQARVWDDMMEVLCDQVPAARAALDRLAAGGEE